MARFDVFPNTEGRGYLLDLQADFLETLDSRIVAPLLPGEEVVRHARRLNPAFRVKGKNHVLLTQSLAAVPVSILKTPVASLREYTTEITNALDMIFYGF